MAINFPNSPTNGDTHTVAGTTYVYDATNSVWKRQGSSGGFDPASVSESLIPDANETYDLGSSTNKFRDLYLSGNSITLGTVELSDNGGALEVTPTGGGSAEPFATETYVTTQVNNLVDAAPGTLDTLNELAAALGDDAAFSTTVTNSLANKLEASDLNGYATETYVNNQITAAGSYSDASVDSHLNQSTATTDQMLVWDGSDYVWNTPAEKVNIEGGFADMDATNNQGQSPININLLSSEGSLHINETDTFDNNGNVLYAAGTLIFFQAQSFGSAIYYTLATPWDTSSTWTHIGSPYVRPSTGGNYYGSASSDAMPTTWRLSYDGDKAFVLDRQDTQNNSSGAIYIYENSNISALLHPSGNGSSYNSAWYQPFNTYTTNEFPLWDFRFSQDGTKIYLTFQSNTGNSDPNEIQRFDLTTPWDLSTASASAVQTLATPTTGHSSARFAISPDGKTGAFRKANVDIIYYTTFSTAFDLTTAGSWSQWPASIDGGNGPADIFFKPDGTKLYIMSDRALYQGKVFQYDIPVSDLIAYATKSYVDTSVANKADTSSLAAVATSGSYNDLSNKPTIPTDNNQLANGAGYITAADIPNTNTIEYTSTSSASVNDVVMLNTDGTVTPVEVTTYPEKLTNQGYNGSYQQLLPNNEGYTISNTNGLVAAHVGYWLFPTQTDNKYISVAFDEAPGSIFEMKIVSAEYNSSTETWTYGTEYQDLASLGNSLGLATSDNPYVIGSPDNPDKFLILGPKKNGGSSDLIIHAIGTMGGVGITWSDTGTNSSNSGPTYNSRLDHINWYYDHAGSTAGSYKIIGAYRDNSSNCRIFRVTWDGNSTIQYSDDFAIPHPIDSRSLDFSKLTEGRFAGVDASGNLRVGDIDWNTGNITVGTAYGLTSFNTNFGTDAPAHVAWRDSSEHFVVAWSVGSSSNNIKLRVFSTTGNSAIAEGSDYTLGYTIGGNGGHLSGNMAFYKNSNMFALTNTGWYYLNNTSNSNDGSFITHFSVNSNLNIVIGTSRVTHGNNSYAKNTGFGYSGKIQMDPFRSAKGSISAPGNTDATNLVVKLFAQPTQGVYTEANVDASKIHGIAASAGTTIDVTVEGGIHTGLSGLTTGSKYYVLSDGSLSATPDTNNAKVGLAMSSTTLAIDLLDELTDAGLATYATKSYVDTSVANLVDSAPATLDTLNELAAALGDDANFSTTVTNSLANKVDTSSLATVATSGSYNDLSNKPTIPTAVDQTANVLSGASPQIDLTKNYFKIDLSSDTTFSTTGSPTNGEWYEGKIEVKGNASQLTHNLVTNPSNQISNWRTTASTPSISGFYSQGYSIYGFFAVSPNGQYAINGSYVGTGDYRFQIIEFSTPGDITTGSLVHQSGNVHGTISWQRSNVYFATNTKFVTSSGHVITVPSGSITTSNPYGTLPSVDTAGQGNWSSDGTKYIGVLEAQNQNSIFKLYTASTPFYANTLTLTQSYTFNQWSIGGDNSLKIDHGNNVHISDDGLNLYTAGYYQSNNWSNQMMMHFTLSTAFDLSTMTYTGNNLTGSYATFGHGRFIEGGAQYWAPKSNGVYGFQNLNTPAVLNTTTWPGTWSWEGGISHSAPPNNETDIINFSSTDGGSTFNAWVEKDSDKSAGFDGQYSSLTGAPTLATVATSGSYNDLSNQPTIPTNNNQLTNGAGYVTSAQLDGDNTVVSYSSTSSASANDVIMLNTDGTVTPVEVTTFPTAVNGSAPQIVPSSTRLAGSTNDGSVVGDAPNHLFKLDGNKYLSVGRHEGGASNFYGVYSAVAEYNSGSWTWGNVYDMNNTNWGTVNWNSEYYNDPYVLRSPDNPDKFLFFKLRTGGSFAAIIGTVNGLTISWSDYSQPSQNYPSSINNSYNVRTEYDYAGSSAGNYKFIVWYGTSSDMKAFRVVWDGDTTITWEDEVTISTGGSGSVPNGNINPVSASFSRVTEGRLCVHNYTAGSLQVYDIDWVNGTTQVGNNFSITASSSTDGTSNYYGVDVKTAWNPLTDEVISINRLASGNPNIRFRRYNVNTSRTITANGNEFSPSGWYLSSTYWLNGDLKFFPKSNVMFFSHARKDSSLDNSFIHYLSTDNASSFTEVYGIGAASGAGINWPFAAKMYPDPFSSGQGSMSHTNRSTGVSLLFGKPIQGEYVESNLDKSKIHGLAATSGTTPDVTTQFGVHSGLSGLTVGSKYYVLDDGTLSTTPDTHNAKIGVAVKSTHIALDFIDELTESDLTTYATKSYVATQTFSGSYNDLTNQPTIPANTSQLANNSGFITAADVPNANVVEYTSTTAASVDDVIMLNSDGTVTPVAVTTTALNTNVAELNPAGGAGSNFNKWFSGHYPSDPLKVFHIYRTGSSWYSQIIEDNTYWSTHSFSGGDSGQQSYPFVSPVDESKVLWIGRDTGSAGAQTFTAHLFSVDASKNITSTSTTHDIVPEMEAITNSDGETWGSTTTISGEVKIIYDYAHSSTGSYFFNIFYEKDDIYCIRVEWDGVNAPTFGSVISVANKFNNRDCSRIKLDPNNLGRWLVTDYSGYIRVYDTDYANGTSSLTATYLNNSVDNTLNVHHADWNPKVPDQIFSLYSDAGGLKTNYAQYTISGSSITLIRSNYLHSAYSSNQYKTSHVQFFPNSDHMVMNYHSSTARNSMIIQAPTTTTGGTGPTHSNVLTSISTSWPTEMVSFDYTSASLHGSLYYPNGSNSALRFIRAGFTTSNFDSNKLHGLAASAGTTIDVTLEHGIHTGLSGLTTGSAYYTNDEGVISTTASGGSKIGTAINATSLALDFTDELVSADLATYATKAYVASQVPSLTGYATETYVNTSVANLVDSAPATLDTLNELAAALGDDANFSTTITNQIAAKADAYSIATVTASGGNFYVDGVQQVTLSFEPGRTYRFDQADSSNGSHPLRFSTTSDGTHGSGSEYTTGVTTNGTAGSAGAYVQIAITHATPTLYYYCVNHSGMGAGSVVGNFSGAYSDLTGAPSIPSAYTDSAVDTHLNQSSATTGQLLSWNGSDYTWTDAASGVTNSDTAPSGAAAGDLWFKSDTADLFLYYTDADSSQWVQVGGAGQSTSGSGIQSSIATGNTSVTTTDTGTDGHIDITTEGTTRWEVTSAGHLLPHANATYDIGSAEKKVRYLFLDSNTMFVGDTSFSEDNIDRSMEVYTDVAAPSSATDIGTKGDVRIVGNYMYVCINTNTWVRTQIETSW